MQTCPRWPVPPALQRVERRAGDPASVVDPASARELTRIDEPQFNHNSGALAFGPDGELYIAVGDGGGADDQPDADMQPFLGTAMVGQNDIEEADIVMGGSNYGWKLKEGTFLFDHNGAAPGFVSNHSPDVPQGMVDPIAQ